MSMRESSEVDEGRRENRSRGCAGRLAEASHSAEPRPPAPALCFFALQTRDERERTMAEKNVSSRV